jgi:hypothetical protein
MADKFHCTPEEGFALQVGKIWLWEPELRKNLERLKQLSFVGGEEAMKYFMALCLCYLKKN